MTIIAEGFVVVAAIGVAGVAVIHTVPFVRNWLRTRKVKREFVGGPLDGKVDKLPRGFSAGIATVYTEDGRFISDLYMLKDGKMVHKSRVEYPVTPPASSP